MLLGLVYFVFFVLSVLLAMAVACAALVLVIIRATRPVGLVTATASAAGAILGATACVVVFTLLAPRQRVEPQAVCLWATAGFAWAGLAGAVFSGALRMLVAFIDRRRRRASAGSRII